jgi:hypothetical protein
MAPQLCSDSSFSNDAGCTLGAVSELATFDAAGRCTGAACTQDECCDNADAQACADSPQFANSASCARNAAAGGNTNLTVSHPNGKCLGAECTLAECCAQPQACGDSAYSDDAGCAGGPDRHKVLFNTTGICAALECAQSECCDAVQLCNVSDFADDSACAAASAPQDASCPVGYTFGVTNPSLCFHDDVAPDATNISLLKCEQWCRAEATSLSAPSRGV